MLEALYYGLPIVTIDDGSTIGILEDKYNAFLVKRDNLEYEVSLKIKELLENEQLKKDMSNNAKRTFKENCVSWEERMKLEYNFIKEIISEHNRNTFYLTT